MNKMQSLFSSSKIRNHPIFRKLSVLPSLRKPSVGLALGGGAVWGIAHIGVLKALEEFRIPIHYISGTSVGALIGGLYAGGIPIDQLEHLALTTQWKDISKFSLPLRGLLSNQPMDVFLNTLLGDKTFEDLKIPFSAVATDLATGEEVILNTGKISTSIRASTAIPGIFQPVQVNGRHLIDGMVVNKIPVSVVKSMGAQAVIAVSLYSSIDHWLPRSSIQVILKSYMIMQRKVASQETAHANVVIDIDAKNFRPMDFSKAEGLLTKGYETTLSQLEKILISLQIKHS